MTDAPTDAPPSKAAEGTPRIYVASLADYNAGRLIGRWIDAAQEADAIHEEIREMLATSREPIAEEWAIHDSECFGGWSPREYESIETVTTVAGQIMDVGEVFGALLNHLGDLDDALRYMEEAYRGEWTSLDEFVESFIDDVYGDHLKGLPEILRFHIDYEGISRDLELGGDLFTVECGHRVHVFDSNI